MVILITVASHTGKTLLAQRILEKYKYPAFENVYRPLGAIPSIQSAMLMVSRIYSIC